MSLSDSLDNLRAGVDARTLSAEGISAPLVRTFYARTGKRLFDVAMAALGLVLFSPLYAVLAILVKLSSRGPILYWQQRVGRGGKIFRIAKFRTMYKDADQRGPSITSASDPRVTSIGRFLRRSKLDELPQLWNVLSGDMSLVGPRPEVPCYVVGYSSPQKQVLSVRPGITDLTSILYRHEETLLGGKSDPEKYYRDTLLPHKVEINLQYLSRVSFLYDLSLVIRTLGCIFAAHDNTPEHFYAPEKSAPSGSVESSLASDPSGSAPDIRESRQTR
jgi:lipopolysaccharide/colanic/teichoic acid biosynthesis glycosyltransferase